MRCSTEELEKHFTLLPEELRSVVLSLPKHEAFNELASKYSLNREQLAKVIDETVLVVLGLTKAREYTHELTDALQMPRVEVYPIATYINEHIFKEVREHLKHAYEEGRFGQKEAVSIQETSKEKVGPVPATPVEKEHALEEPRQEATPVAPLAPPIQAPEPIAIDTKRIDEVTAREELRTERRREAVRRYEDPTIQDIYERYALPDLPASPASSTASTPAPASITPPIQAIPKESVPEAPLPTMPPKQENPIPKPPSPVMEQEVKDVSEQKKEIATIAPSPVASPQKEAHSDTLSPKNKDGSLVDVHASAMKANEKVAGDDVYTIDPYREPTT